MTNLNFCVAIRTLRLACVWSVLACGAADSLSVYPGADGGSPSGGSTVGMGPTVTTTVDVGTTVAGTTVAGAGGDFGFGGGTVTVGVGGAGGFGAGGATGGIGGSIDGGTWEQQQLARLRKGIVGTWSGQQTNPWGPPCATTMAFFANGQYAGHSPGDRCVVYYYGTNADSSEKKYVLNDILASGEGSGEIEIYFGPGNTNRGTLQHVVLSDDENLLSFECWKEQYGPLVFSLERLTR